MAMKVLISLVILSIFLLSCQDGGAARFIVKNRSRSKIDSLYFLPGDRAARVSLTIEPGGEKQYRLPMAGQTTDGSYGLLFKKDGRCLVKPFGYFSNGVVLEKYTVVEIEDDTVIFKPVY